MTCRIGCGTLRAHGSVRAAGGARPGQARVAAMGGSPRPWAMPSLGRCRPPACPARPAPSPPRASPSPPPAASPPPPAAPQPPADAWVLKYLYDGDCPMCRTLKNVLTRQDGGAGRVAFVNIADRTYSEKETGVTYEDAMDTIHVIKRDGSIVTGPDALRLLYDTVGLGWAARAARLPVVSWLVDRAYDLISKYRLGIGGVDAVIAMKRLSQVDEGTDTCDKTEDDEECDAPEW